MDTPTRRPVWSYVRFSVRGLIVVVLLIAVTLGRIVHPAHVQRDAVAAIARAGGTVDYDWQIGSNGRRLPNPKPWAPKWLVDQVGIDHFGHVARINLLKRGFDRDLISIGHLSQVWNLSLDFSPVTDDGLAHLEGLVELERLYLPFTEVGDAGLVHLKGLTDLRQLSLQGDSITDEGLDAIWKELTNLEVLDLDRTRVNGKGLAQLKGLKRLVRLSLRGAPVDDAALKHLQGMTGLRELFLDDTRVTYTGVREIQKALPNLKISRRFRINRNIVPRRRKTRNPVPWPDPKTSLEPPMMPGATGIGAMVEFADQFRPSPNITGAQPDDGFEIVT